MMNLNTLLALTCVLALTGCEEAQKTAPLPLEAQQAQTPTKAPPAQQATTSQPSKALPKLPSAAELIALIDRATRIEAKSGKWSEQPEWSKDLTKADIANLKAGIGEATKLSAMIPRCVPSVVVTLYQQKNELATLGAFCDRGSLTGPIRFDINKVMGSFIPQDLTKVGAALKSPVDK